MEALDHKVHSARETWFVHFTLWIHPASGGGLQSGRPKRIGVGIDMHSRGCVKFLVCPRYQ
jgi:hypothetical protein